MSDAINVDALLTPLDVERELVKIVARLDKSPNVIKYHHNELRDARTAYRQAYALAFTTAEGTQSDKKYAAELATVEEQAAADVAEVSYKYVCDTEDSLKTKLRALQSVGSLMKASMFGTQGGL